MRGPVQRVLLAVPNFRWAAWNVKTFWQVIPYNLCLLAAVLGDEYETLILDATAENLSEEAFVERVRRAGPDLVGLTMLMDEYGASAHTAARLLKAWSPEVPVVLGGVYATVNAREVCADPHFDYVVIGEGECVFPALLRHLNGRGPFPPAGVAYRRDGAPVVPARAPFIGDLDTLPLPAYDKIDFMSYAMRGGRVSVDGPRRFPYARVFTSRGCPVGCAFCQAAAVAGEAFRPRSAANVLDELEWLKSRYGVRFVIFDDDNLLLNRARAVEIFRGMIARGLDLQWNTIGVAVFRLDDELIDLMKASGCAYMDLAVESGVERVLRDIIRKPVDLARVPGLVARARAAGIDVAAHIIVGFPGETWAEIRESIRYLESLEADYAKIFVTVPLKHTRLYDLARAADALRPGFSFEAIDWSKGQLQTAEFTARQLTILRAFEWDRINFTDPSRRRKIAGMMGVDEADLNAIRRETLRAATE